jgi:CTD small phosphatase-like protein 2
MTTTQCAATKRKLTVVLDMDECLIHSSNFSDRAASSSARQAEFRPDNVGGDGAVETFLLDMGDGVTCTVHKRPGLEAFLQACAAEFDTYVMTAGTQPYAEPLLDTLDPQNELLLGRFYRHHCRKVAGPRGTQYLKDLEAVLPKNTDPGRMVLVDNNPMSFVCQPDNGILVPDFHGAPDDVLERVLGLLHQLDIDDADVRPRLREMFRLEERLAPVRDRLGLGPTPTPSKL